MEPECLAVSAKRYVLFNRDSNGSPIIRKASAHGLGHLLPPYDDPDKGKRIERIGVELWQEDYWKAIIKAADGDNPDVVNTSELVGFDQPAASRYAATKPALLRWFQNYNEGVPASRQIGPFNFLLVLQAKSKVELAKVDPAALSSPAWTKRHPRPAAPYFKTATLAAPYAFDRDDKKGAPVPIAWLKTHGRSLNMYHLHRESKFRGSNYDERGILSRRHVFALAVQSIGKEADNLEEREAVGDDDGSIEYQLSVEERTRLIASVREARDQVGVREFTRTGRISHHTLAAILAGKRSTKKVDAIADFQMPAWQVSNGIRTPIGELAVQRLASSGAANSSCIQRQHSSLCAVNLTATPANPSQVQQSEWDGCRFSLRFPNL